MNSLSLHDRVIKLDDEFYLIDLNDWSETVAELLAKQEGIQLTEAHWEIIALCQEFYREFDLSPANRALVKYVSQKLGKEKGNSAYLNRLFLGKPAKLVARLAGLPKPANCF